MTISLEGKTIVVTGGAKRIGRAVCLECARAGANVAFSFHTSRAEAETTLRELKALAPAQRFAAFPLDVARADEWKTLVEQVEAEFGTVFGLVNNAAIFKRTPLAQLSEADFDAHIAANLKGPFLGCLALGERLETGGAIVNFSDIYASRPLANYIPYCVSKAGVEMLTKSFAKALAPRGVRVNCIAPGAILPGEGEGDDAATLLARVPLQRLGTPEEIAQAVLFLLNGPGFVTGITLPVEGGQLLR